MEKARDKKIIIRKCYTIDAEGQALGRIATEAAKILRGKHKVSFYPNRDIGDYVKIKNFSKIKFTGKKMDQKYFYHHTKYPGGIKESSLKKLFCENPQRVIYNAIIHMIPKNRLRNTMIKRLTVKL